MPSVRKDTTPTEGGRVTIGRLTSTHTAPAGVAGNAMPKQQDAHVEQKCVWWV